MECKSPLSNRWRWPADASSLYLASWIIASLLSCGLCLPAVAQQVKPLGFKNLESAPAGGLILDLESGGRCDVQLADTGAFSNWSGDRREIRVGGGNIPPRGSTRLVLRHNCSSLAVREWWWLDGGGSRLGDRKREPPDIATANFSSSFMEDSHSQTVLFTTPDGDLSLAFPLALMAGDTISGTLTLQAVGDARQRPRHLEQLRFYSVNVGQEDIPGDRQQWTRTLPTEVPSGYLDITLWDAIGALVSANVVPVQPSGAIPAATEFRLPFLSHAGAPLRVIGPFDGDTTTTTVTMDGVALVPLAESPRGFIGWAPSRVAGMAQVEIREGAVTARGSLRNVVLEVRAPKDTIGSGERLQMEILVRGLAGLEQPLTVGVVNRTIGLAHFIGDPRYIQHTIKPQDIQDGQITFPLEMEGSAGGTYIIEPRLELGAQ